MVVYVLDPWVSDGKRVQVPGLNKHFKNLNCPHRFSGDFWNAQAVQ
jgi:hypothetical protein